MSALSQGAQPAATLSAGAGAGTGSNNSVVCRTSKMTWGDVELQGEDARLLAKVLLRRRLTSLGALLGELREILAGVWNKNWAQQTDSFRACEASLMASMDKLVTLVGQLR